MKRLFLSLIGLISLEAYSAKLPFEYVCTFNEATGFAFEKGVWAAKEFDLSKKRFFIKYLTVDDPGFDNKDETPYGVFIEGKNRPEQFCRINEETIFTCSGLGELRFSSDTGRFIKTDPFGYVHDSEDKSISPKIMRGTCKPVVSGREASHKAK